MKDYLRQLVSEKESVQAKRLAVREYLQARMLQSLQECGSFVNWAFLGGTALHFLYGLPRFSEDLDFSLRDPSEDARFMEAMNRILRDFEAVGYTTAFNAKVEKTVCSSFVKFPGLLYTLGLSPHETEVLSIKIEIDTNPPAGAGFAASIVRRPILLRLMHHDKPSLLAGKLHALLSRKYTKGRDLFDLVWYLADPTWPAPNLDLLNNALVQTQWKGPPLTAASWRDAVAGRLESVDWRRAAEDLEPFLERTGDLALVTKENCLDLIRAR